MADKLMGVKVVKKCLYEAMRGLIYIHKPKHAEKQALEKQERCPLLSGSVSIPNVLEKDIQLKNLSVKAIKKIFTI